MTSLEARSFDEPDERRTPEKTTVDLVTIGGTTLGRFTFQPGWRWSEHVKPVVKTEQCQVNHIGYVLQGRLHVVHEDGSEAEVGPGGLYHVAPGHEGWVVGDEPFVSIELQGADRYAGS